MKTNHRFELSPRVWLMIVVFAFVGGGLTGTLHRPLPAQADAQPPGKPSPAERLQADIDDLVGLNDDVQRLDRCPGSSALRAQGQASPGPSPAPTGSPCGIYTQALDTLQCVHEAISAPYDAPIATCDGVKAKPRP
jgi:hypothetical protein